MPKEPYEDENTPQRLPRACKRKAQAELAPKRARKVAPGARSSPEHETPKDANPSSTYSVPGTRKMRVDVETVRIFGHSSQTTSGATEEPVASTSSDYNPRPSSSKSK